MKRSISEIHQDCQRTIAGIRQSGFWGVDACGTLRHIISCAKEYREHVRMHQLQCLREHIHAVYSRASMLDTYLPRLPPSHTENAISGHLTPASMLAVCKAFTCHEKYPLSRSSVFLDVGSGLGHLVHCFSGLGIRAAFGVELQAMVLVQSIILQKKLLRGIHTFRAPAGFFHHNVLRLSNLNRVTHVYTFSIGMAQDVLRHILRLCAMSDSVQVLMMFFLRKSDWVDLGLDLQANDVQKLPISMAGSRSSFTGYLIPRNRFCEAFARCKDSSSLPLFPNSNVAASDILTSFTSSNQYHQNFLCKSEDELLSDEGLMPPRTRSESCARAQRLNLGGFLHMAMNICAKVFNSYDLNVLLPSWQQEGFRFEWRSLYTADSRTADDAGTGLFAKTDIQPGTVIPCLGSLEKSGFQSTKGIRILREVSAGEFEYTVELPTQKKLTVRVV